MAIPTDPTATSLVTDALRHAGMPTPTAGQVTELLTEGFQTVKTDLWSACTRDRLLETSVMVLLPLGSGQVDTPDDFDHEILLDVFSCAAAMAFTATAGGATQITAAATFSADVSSIRGLYVFTTSGTGLRQYRQITDYDDTTKILIVTPAWAVNPAVNTTAFIGHLRRRLVLDDPNGWSSSLRYPNQGYPTRYKVVGTSALTTDTPAIELSPVPDSANYALVLTYGPNLTRLNETGSLLVKHLRERRALWIQGLVTQAMRRYDEARYPVEESKWQLALQRYGGHNPTYDRAEPER